MRLLNKLEPVLITMKGTDEGGEQVELLTEGILAKTKHGFALRYEEYLGQAEASTVTFVDCTDDSLTILRSGSVTMAMSFQKGKPFESQHLTPLGALTLRIFPTELSIRRKGLTGRILLSYQVSYTSQLSSLEEGGMHTLHFRFRPTKCHQ